MARHRDPLTTDLFDWQPPKVAVGYSGEIAGRGPLDNRIARLIGHALRDVRDEGGLTRAKVAAKMSEFLQRPVSEAMLNKWSSEGSGDHRITLDAFIALVHATGALNLLGFAPGEFGLTVIEDEYAEMIELQMLRQKQEELAAKEKLLVSKLRSKR